MNENYFSAIDKSIVFGLIKTEDKVHIFKLSSIVCRHSEEDY